MPIVRNTASIVLAALTLTACAAKTVEGSPQVQAQAGGPCTKIDAAAQVSKARDLKAKASLPAEVRQASGPGTWAFASQPVDIAGPGDYTFRFGPLTAEFDYGKTVTSVAYVPPPDFAGRVTPLAKEDPSVVSEGGQRYFQLTMHVGGAVVPCTGLVLFIE